MSSQAVHRVPLPDQVTIWETADAVYVGWAGAGEGEDWLARFDKAEGFPARAWAERMVSLCNGRASQPLDPIGPLSSHGP